MTQSPSSLGTNEPLAQPAEAAPVEYVQLPRQGLYQHLAKLADEDPDVRQNLDTLIGRKAAERYHPEIARRDREIEHLRKLNRQREVQAMKPEEIEKRFIEDANFAKEYAELAHYQPPDLNEEAEQERILTAVTEVFSWAEKKGLPAAKIEEFKHKAASGAYGDETVHWTVSLSRLQADLAEEFLRVPGATPPVNSRLVQPGPDTQRGSRPATDGLPGSIQEFRRLPAEQRQAIANSPEGMAHLEKLAKQGN